MSMDINETSFVGKSECTSFLFEESAYMERLLEKEKRELAEEYMWLRKSFKGALQKSWNKVESLQCQCADHIKVKKDLDVQLNDIREEKEAWRLRCLAAEKIQAMQSKPNKSPKDMTRSPLRDNLQEMIGADAFENNNNMQQTYEKPSMTFRDKIRSWSNRNLSSVSWSSGNLLGMEEDTKSSLSCEPGKACRPGFGLIYSQSMRLCSSKDPSGTDESYRKVLDAKLQSRLDRSEPMVDLYDNNTTNISEDYLGKTLVQTTDTPCTKNSFFINGNSKSQEDLPLIISSRDQIISNLEQTINQQLKSMQNLETEMQRSMEAQRIKKKRLRSSHKQKEDRLQKVIKSQRRILKENKETAKKYDKSLLDCRSYIQELTGELEKLLKIIKIAQEGGYIIEQNLPP